MPLAVFLRGRVRLFLLYLVLMALMSLLVLLENPWDRGLLAISYMNTVGLVLLAVYLVNDWFVWHGYVATLSQSIDSRQGGLIPVIPKAGNVEQTLFNRILSEVNSTNSELVGGLRRERREAVEFLGGWVHEIRTPISVSRLVLSSEQVPEGLRDSLEEELTRIERLVEQILYYTKAGELSRDFFVGDACLGEVAKAALARHRKGFQTKGIHLEFSDDGSRTDSDPKWLGFIMDQLLTNALKYTPYGGRVSVAITRDREGMVMAVEDTGCGIPSEDQSRIFDLGFTGANGRSNLSASGMGLYLAKLLATRMGHGLTASSPGNGSGTRMAIRFFNHHDYFEPLP